MSERLSLDEIQRIVTEIARDESAGPDRFRALKMLTSMNTAAVVLDPPLSSADVILRLARLMKASGLETCQIAFREAFPRKKTAQLHDRPKMFLDELPDELKQKAQRCTSLKRLNKMFPEVKRPGFPEGFPQRAGPLTKQEWCQRRAAAILLDRLQRENQDPANPELPTESDERQPAETAGAPAPLPG